MPTLTKPQPTPEVPPGLEWLASQAAREMDRRREELVCEIVANDKRARQASETLRTTRAVKAVRKAAK